MGYPVYYSGEIDIQPPLSEEHASLVEAVVNMEKTPQTEPIFAAIAASEESDLPYHGGLLEVSEDRSRIEPCEGEQRHGVRLWLIHLLAHLFIPQGYTLNGSITWDASDDPEDRGCVYIKDNVLEAVDYLIFDPGPSWEPNHFTDDAMKTALGSLIESADNTGCTSDLTVVSADALKAVQDLLAKTA